MRSAVDLNADMGESFGRWELGDDAALMPFLSSANVACGFHGGDPVVLRRTVRLAKEHGVGIGAHVAFPDLLGFGRRHLELSPAEVKDYVTYQLGAVAAFACAAGERLQHVKPHGALYTACAARPDWTRALCEAIAEQGEEIALLTVPQAGEVAREAGVPFVPEGYVDLDYADDGSLVIERAKRRRDPEETAERALRLVRDGTAPTTSGGELALEVASICIHGDAPNAPEIARSIRERLEGAGVAIAPLRELVGAAGARR